MFKPKNQVTILFWISIFISLFSFSFGESKMNWILGYPDQSCDQVCDAYFGSTCSPQSSGQTYAWPTSQADLDTIVANGVLVAFLSYEQSKNSCQNGDSLDNDAIAYDPIDNIETGFCKFTNGANTDCSAAPTTAGYSRFCPCYLSAHQVHVLHVKHEAHEAHEDHESHETHETHETHEKHEAHETHEAHESGGRRLRSN